MKNVSRWQTARPLGSRPHFHRDQATVAERQKRPVRGGASQAPSPHSPQNGFQQRLQYVMAQLSEGEGRARLAGGSGHVMQVSRTIPLFFSCMTARLCCMKHRTDIISRKEGLDWRSCCTLARLTVLMQSTSVSSGLDDVQLDGFSQKTAFKSTTLGACLFCTCVLK